MERAAIDAGRRSRRRTVAAVKRSARDVAERDVAAGGAAAAAVDATFQRAVRAGARNAAGRAAADAAAAGAARRRRRDGRTGAHDALTDGARDLRVAAEERSHIHRGPGALFAGTTSGSPADDVIHRRGRIPEFGTRETSGARADRGEAGARIAAQPVANGVGRQRGAVDPRRDDVIG